MLAEEAFRHYPLYCLWTGNDVASQAGMMMNVRMWRQLVKPALQLVFQVGKVQKSWVAYHCCGALCPIIPDLIEMGMNVLNPVQVNCSVMELADLMHEFGDLITFMGGVETQRLLPKATANEVCKAKKYNGTDDYWRRRIYPGSIAYYFTKNSRRNRVTLLYW